ncbi:hypothetical protein Syun_017465 [Stephania yunnanensis]|uniref:Uncharacterized protein n=1 Tax=Stephania yunnanensis TaxID=152371 RepID=A0AAP0J731_9MAGN
MRWGEGECGGKGGKATETEKGQRRRRRQATAADEESRGEATLGSMASACKQRAESRKERDGGERRGGGVTRGVEGVGVRCRGRREAAKSRTTTAIVADGDDSGGDDGAAAVKGVSGGLRREGRGRWVFDFTFFVMTDQR